VGREHGLYLQSAAFLDSWRYDDTQNTITLSQNYLKFGYPSENSADNVSQNHFHQQESNFIDVKTGEGIYINLHGSIIRVCDKFR
jgi:hypothetical protein